MKLVESYLVVLFVCLFSQVALSQSSARHLGVDYPLYGEPQYEDMFLYYLKQSPSLRQVKRNNLENLKSQLAKADSRKKPALRLRVIAALEAQIANAWGKDLERFVDEWKKAYAVEREDSVALKLTAARPILAEVLAQYREMFADDERLQNNPEEVFRLAGWLVLNGDRDNAKLYLDQLVQNSPPKGAAAKNDPAAIFADWATLGLGFIESSRGQHRKAFSHFKSRHKSASKVVHAYGRYAAAWSAKLQKTKDSLNKLVASLKSCGQNAISKNPKATQHLQAECNRDLAFVWGESLRVADAKRHFKDKEFYFATLARAAYTAIRQKNYGKSAVIGKSLLKEAEGRQEAALTALSLTRWAHSKEQFAHSPRFLAQAVTMVLDKKSNWRRQHKKSRQTIADYQEYVRLAVAHFGSKTAKVAEKNQKAIKSGIQILGIYVSNFHRSSDIHEKRLVFASLLAESRRPKSAATQFLKVAADERGEAKNGPDQAMRKQAVAKALSLATQLLQGSDKNPPAKNSAGLEKQKIPDEKIVYIEIVDVFTKLNPGSPLVPQLAYIATKIQVDFGHHETARERTLKLADTHTNSREAAKAISLVLASQEKQKKWQDLIASSDEFLKSKIAKIQRVEGVILDFKKKGLWQIARTLMAKKKYKESAARYFEFAKDFPNDQATDKALFIAMATYKKLGKGKETVDAGRILTGSHKASKYRPNGLYMMAEVYENLIEFDSAGQAYERFSDDYPRDKRAMSALYSASKLYLDAENIDASVKVLNKLVTRYPRSALALRALTEKAENSEKIEEYVQAMKAYQKIADMYMTTNPEMAMYGLAKAKSIAHFEGDKKASNAIAIIGNKLRKMPKSKAQKTRGAVGSFQLEYLESQNKDFPESVVGYRDPEDFAKTAKKIVDSLNSQERKYLEVVQLENDDTSVSAYFELGKLYERALKSFNGKPDKEELTAKEVSELNRQQEKIRLTLKSKMIKIWERGHNLARSRALHTDSQVAMYKKLSVYSRKRYQPVYEQHLKPETVSHSVGYGGRGHAGNKSL